MRLISCLISTIACAALYAEGATEPAPAVTAPTPGMTAAPAEGERKSPLIALDLDKNGELSIDEIAACTNERLKGKIHGADTNNDGSLDKGEFEALVTTMRNRKVKGEKVPEPARLPPVDPEPAAPAK